MPSSACTDMSTDAPEHGATLVEAKLRKAWRKERRYYHGDGLAHFLVWLLALILVDLLVDWLFLLPGTGRLVLLGVNLVALGWVLWHYWLRHLRPYNPVRVALQVERRHPELESLLVSYVQLAGDSPEATYASPSLLRVLRRQTFEVTRPIDFREIISYRELKRIAALSLAVIAFFGLYSVNWSEHLEVLFRRLLDPTSKLGYPTRTTIDWVTGDVTLRQGDSITIGARAGGLLPARGTLTVEPRGGEEERIPIFPGEEETEFAYRFREVFQPFDYSVRLGDARSLPLADGEVDAALAHMVVQYLASPAEALREMARAVRAGGVVVVVDFLHHEHEWMRQELGVSWLGFAEDEVADWSADAGLHGIRIETQPAAAGARDLPATFIASGRRPR